MAAKAAAGPPPLSWNTLRQKGILYEQWIAGNDSTRVCPYRSCPLTYTELAQFAPATGRNDLSQWVWKELRKLNLAAPNNSGNLQWFEFNSAAVFTAPWPVPAPHPYGGMVTFEAFLAPGLLVIEQMFRAKGPYMSSTARVVYEHFFPNDQLDCIAVISIINPETQDFVNKLLRPPSRPQNASDWAPISYEIGSYAYSALLGTEIGKAVAAIVIETFPRGTRKISRIVTWRQEMDPDKEFWKTIPVAGGGFQNIHVKGDTYDPNDPTIGTDLHPVEMRFIIEDDDAIARASRKRSKHAPLEPRRSKRQMIKKGLA